MASAASIASIRDYLRQFPDVCAVYIDAGMKARTNRSLAQVRAARSAAWTTRVNARKIARHINAHRVGIDEAARALGIPVTTHDALMARVAHAVGRVDGALAEAKQQGALKFFHREYKARRQRGVYKAGYRVALGALRRSIFKRAASGQHLPSVGDPTILFEVFGALRASEPAKLNHAKVTEAHDEWY